MNKHEIIKKLFSEDNDEVVSALIEISDESINDKEIIQEVMKLFKLTENEAVREIIVDYFKKIDDDELNRELVKLFSSKSAFLRNAAMEILRDKRGNVIDVLIESMNSDDKDIRKLSVDTAYKIDDPKKVEVLKKGLKDKDINVVITTIEYIGDLGLKEFKEAVFKIYQETDVSFLKVVALETLSVIGDRDILKKLKSQFGEFEDIDPILIFPYLRIIGNFGSSEDIEYLTDAMDLLDTSYLKEIMNAIEHIVRNNNIEKLPDNTYKKIEAMIFKDINSINKYGLITFLGNFKNKQLDDTLKKCLAESDRMLILGCLEVIGLKGKESEFKEELLSIKDRFKDDEEIISLLEDLI